MPYCHESTAWHCTARDWVHMYTQPHSYYSSIPCCLVHVTLELSHWHLRKKIGHYIMADFGLRNGLLWWFSNTRTFVTAPLFRWLVPFFFLWLEWILQWGDITLHLLEDWTSQIQEVPWSTHPPIPDTTPTKWSIHWHTLQTVAINITRWHATALYHFKTYINRVFLFCLITSKHSV